MSELKAETIVPQGTTITLQMYPKGEVDKAIADLEESHKKEVEQLLMEIVKLKEFSAQCQSAARTLQRKLRYNKYKRSLAMAWWCEATALWCYQAANTLPAGFHATLYGKPVMIEPDRLFKRHALLTKWSAKWRELAEKFKPNKSTAQ